MMELREPRCDGGSRFGKSDACALSMRRERAGTPHDGRTCGGTGSPFTCAREHSGCCADRGTFHESESVSCVGCFGSVGDLEFSIDAREVELDRLHRHP